MSGHCPQALSLAPARVAIVSITEQSARRRLLAASVAVLTTATVAPTPLSAVMYPSSHRLQFLSATYRTPLCRSVALCGVLVLLLHLLRLFFAPHLVQTFIERCEITHV